MKSFIFFSALASFAYAADVPCCMNGLPNVSSLSENHCHNVNVSVDFLYWTAEEDGIGNDNWGQILTNPDPITKVVDIQVVSFDYSPGFRVGIGYDLPYDQWDTKISYTWFRTEAKDHISTNGEISSPFFGNFFASTPLFKYKQASIQFTILFNMFDWELGRKYWVSEGLSVRPFAGLKGGWIDQTIRTRWTRPDLAAAENIKNNFWGFGPSGGLKTQWKIGNNENRFFSLIGDFAGALMWANWSIPDVYKNSNPQKVTVRFDEFFLASLMFQSFIGIGWETNFNKDRSHFAVRAGYELQFWLEQFQVFDWNVGKLNNQLSLLGGTFDFRFDF